jgi:hypothetical protein
LRKNANLHVADDIEDTDPGFNRRSTAVLRGIQVTAIVKSIVEHTGTPKEISYLLHLF